MIDDTFSIMCQVCSGKVDSFTQSVKFILTDNLSIQEAETIQLSCGCTIDFPDWQIDVTTGICKIYNFANTLYIQFLDEDLLLEDED